MRYRNRSGVVELVGRDRLLFAKVENDVTKFSLKKKKTPTFWIKTYSFQYEESSFFWPRKN